jgi:tetratricopeptide (TPR) repeat protein
MPAWLLLLASLASAQTVDRETLEVIGWNNACSIAVAHYGYPALGAGIADEPIAVRIGTLTITPGNKRARTKWRIAVNGAYAYQPDEMKEAFEVLRKEGYVQQGIVEEIHFDPGAAGLEDPVRSTATLSASNPAGWPGKDYRLVEIRYSPLGTCAYLTYKRLGYEKDYFWYLLTRVEDPRARVLRSRAHVSRALMLLQAGELAEALAETKVAAAIAPNLALARYHHAAALCMSGYLPESLAELAEAVKLDPKHKAQAREDADFESLRKDPRFKELTFQPRVRTPGPAYVPRQGGVVPKKETQEE